MVQVLTIKDVPTFDMEPKAVLRTVVDKYKGAELDDILIEASRLPEILASLVPSWDIKELDTLIAAVDEDDTGKLSLSKISQILIYFLKKQAERNTDLKKNLLKISLKISTQMCISQDEAIMIVYFYPQIIKAIDDGHCILQ
ncbi:uncharacterized protein LOC110844614 [Folsomia candida]|uniref:EF-hand domain-containing protein n=1 Tax=Folsomia candida TaxID=158441 RepID=A0A226ET20_FOLCA|nr:uncharacterized protein LOC110844614 [Folsomia candida]OXA60317.1 hypothetical protein Fcan01_04650 [Folsomia candida]